MKNVVHELFCSVAITTLGSLGILVLLMIPLFWVEILPPDFEFAQPALRVLGATAKICFISTPVAMLTGRWK